ncbi:MAG: helix-turn-helix domain-containing protein [Oscillospiraceae bacterium]|nr:helix-turn-helix domain-containing protein [Oscillospiraceae bacterium]
MGVILSSSTGETGFPTDQYAYVCTTPIEGKANHLCFPGQTPEVLLDELMELFSQYQQMESMIDQLTYRNATLQELCELGTELLENPVYIHDDWFIIIGMSRQAEQLMAPEYVTPSTMGFVPRVILDDFQHDSDYLETYAHPNAQIWKGVDGVPDSLYVNLWDGNLYRGRFLVIRDQRDFRKADFMLAEVLAQRAIFLLQKKLPGQQPQYQSMDDILFSLLEGRQTEAADLSHLLLTMRWNKDDLFLCIRIRSQEERRNAVIEHVLHSDLFQLFPGSYVMFSGQEQCLVMDLEHHYLPSDELRHQLAVLCRDYCLYAGISSPVTGIRELHAAYYQAGVALDQAFRLRCEKWIMTFSECVLEYMVRILPSPLTPGHLVASEWHVLLNYDRENSTQYFETFREYLLKERDIPKTSEALIIHRTTLLYRLKKIQSLIRINLDDPWQRLYLTLSLWILENEQQK